MGVRKVCVDGGWMWVRCEVIAAGDRQDVGWGVDVDFEMNFIEEEGEDFVAVQDRKIAPISENPILGDPHSTLDGLSSTERV